MFATQGKTVAAVLCVLGALVGTGALAAQREGERGLKRIDGFVQTVDAAKNTINILVRRDQPDGQNFDLVKDVKVVLVKGRETKDGTLAAVQPRTRVVLFLDETKKTVQRIEVHERPTAGGERRPDGHTVYAQVSAVDAAKNTITLRTGGRDQPVTDQTYPLTKDAKVLIHQGRKIREAKLADLAANTPVQVRFDDARKFVQAIDIQVSLQVYGQVAAIDPAKKTITLESGRGEKQTKTYPLAAEVKVFFRLPSLGDRRGAGVDHQTAKLVAVVNRPVTLQLDDDLKIVQSIEANLPTIQGTLQDVDAAKQTILVRPARGDDEGIKVAKDARIIVNGKQSTLASLTVGSEVQLTLSVDQTEVLAIQTPVGRR